jgi:hypothetical protein
VTAPRADEVTVVDLTVSGTLFAAMIYLAALAYPEDLGSRDIFIAAMKARCVRDYNASGKDRLRAAMRVQQQDGQMRRGFSRIRYRLQMADAFSPVYLTEVSAQLLPTSRLSIRGGGSLTHNLKELTKTPEPREAFRQWSATAPVLHLALSLRAHLVERAAILEHVPGSMELLREPGWVKRALRNAEGHAATLRKLRRWKSWQLRLLLRC